MTAALQMMEHCCRFHTECVDLFQSLHEGFFSHSTSHIYNAIITSYLKVSLSPTVMSTSCFAIRQLQHCMLGHEHALDAASRAASTSRSAEALCMLASLHAPL